MEKIQKIPFIVFLSFISILYGCKSQAPASESITNENIGKLVSSQADSNGVILPDYAIDVLHVFSKWEPKWEVMQCDEKPTLKISGYDGYRLVLRQSHKEYLNLPQQRELSYDNLNYEIKYTYIDQVIIKNENTLSENFIEKIPWLELEQEYFTKPVYMGKGQGFDWFTNTTLYVQEFLRRGLNLEGGDDRIKLLMDGLYIQDKGYMTANSVPPLLSEFGDKAVDTIERAVQTCNEKDLVRNILLLNEIQTQKSTELLRRYYYSENNTIKNTATACLTHGPLRKQAKKEYFDMLSKQRGITAIGNACIEFNWKDALPLFKDICSKPKGLTIYYLAYPIKRKLEGNPIPEELIKAMDTIIKFTMSTQENIEDKSKAIAEAKQIFIDSPDKEAAAAIAISFVNFITKGNNIQQVRDNFWDILSKLPKSETTKLYKILEESADSEEDRDLLQKFQKILN
ncbi:MAG: hypothetical protein JW787_05610 [Sedimentisphaerales bacterium]|nr:hypothetical protein [Sedimentisphaerales bacterium]